jgi:PilZ domain
MSDHKSIRADPALYSMGPDAPGRRKHSRYLFSEAMTVRSEQGMEMPGISVEMSARGMSAVVSRLLREGETVQLEPVAGGRTAALVRHKLGRLHGFEFVDLSADQLAKIAESCEGFGWAGETRRGLGSNEVAEGAMNAKNHCPKGQ